MSNKTIEMNYLMHLLIADQEKVDDNDNFGPIKEYPTTQY